MRAREVMPGADSLKREQEDEKARNGSGGATQDLGFLGILQRVTQHQGWDTICHV